ncbi:Uncharacterised protein [BD1-7 clade bacterium]|nr:Uncharacterised protein [BD1-7 clade bacterium]
MSNLSVAGFLLVVVGVFSFSVASAQTLEDFSSYDWENHEDLGESVDVGLLTLSVDAGGSLKAVTKPHGIQMGYRKDAVTKKLTIAGPAEKRLNIHSLDATDLAMMVHPQVTVTGYRDDTVIAEQTMGPLWDEATRSGIAVMLSGFTNLTHLEIVSAGVDEDDSDIYFFLDMIEYEVTDVPVPPAPPKPAPPKFGGWPLMMLVTLCLLAVARRWRELAR